MIELIIKKHIADGLNKLYGVAISAAEVVLENTKPDFEGDYTYVTFTMLKLSKKSPEQTAHDIGGYLSEHMPEMQSFNVIKGFLNIVVNQQYWISYLNNHYHTTDYGFVQTPTNQKIIVEYSSPNTNKPLHLGHIRNNLLGYAVSKILQANGHQVYTCNLINDRGIHICKSMLAWIQSGGDETPENSGLKGDHLVGKYYVLFDKQYKKEQEELIQNGATEEEAKKRAPSILAAQELLRKWEDGDQETINIWKTMNSWVYEGFEATYKRLGVGFDTFYYESNTYLLGKDIVAEGLAKDAFYRKEDSSVWVDLSAEGLDEKLLLRRDGTSVYMTQDLGTADKKYQ
ncbi:MAG: arginine--tRNA ligase, partial [Bacteroidetes bacterium]